MQKSGLFIPALARCYWQMPTVRGIVLILCGLLAIFWPHLTFKLFFICSGIFAISEGGRFLISALSRRAAMQRGSEARKQSMPVQGNLLGTPGVQKHWTILLVKSILSILCGLLCLILPALAAVLAVYAIAIWAMVKGVAALTQIAQRGRLMGLIGALATLLGLTLLLNPLGAIRAFLWSIGLLALIIGLRLLLRGKHRQAATRAGRPRPFG